MTLIGRLTKRVVAREYSASIKRNLKNLAALRARPTTGENVSKSLEDVEQQVITKVNDDPKNIISRVQLSQRGSAYPTSIVGINRKGITSKITRVRSQACALCRHELDIDGNNGSKLTNRSRLLVRARTNL